MLRHDVQVLTLIGICAASSLFVTGILLGRAHGVQGHDHLVRGETIVFEVPPETSAILPERPRITVRVSPEHAFQWRESQPVVLRSGPAVTWKKWGPKPSFRIETREGSPTPFVGLRYLWEKPIWSPWRSENGPLDFEFRFQPSR